MRASRMFPILFFRLFSFVRSCVILSKSQWYISIEAIKQRHPIARMNGKISHSHVRYDGWCRREFDWRIFLRYSASHFAYICQLFILNSVKCEHLILFLTYHHQQHRSTFPPTLALLLLWLCILFLFLPSFYRCCCLLVFGENSFYNRIFLWIQCLRLDA